MKHFKYNCLNCNKNFKAYHSKNKTRKFCCLKCSCQYNSQLKAKNSLKNSTKNCLYCKNIFIFYNCKSTIRKFCSRSCSAFFNNPKTIKKLHPCLECKKLTPCYAKGKKRKLCSDCNHPTHKNGKKTIKEMSYNVVDQNRYRKIRIHAHRIAQKLMPIKICAHCKYDKHVELAHKKPIHSFSLSTKLKKVNDISNLIKRFDKFKVR